MADSNATGEESEQQITFNVKSSADAKYIITVPLSSKVGDLKQKLATSEYADLPPERQRLIYSGRVLKDADTVGSCKIKDGNTVHLVKGAESNQRQNPANQGGAASVPSGAGQPASNVPTNIAAGSGAGNPLAHLTGARYAGFHGLPGADMFGADGGMGAPPDANQMLRLLEDPNFAQQMNEAMNNPAVLDHLRNNPMIRDNPAARAAIENPEMRRLMFNPEMIRMQMRMQEQMGGGAGGGASAFPMPGQTDTTPAPDAGTQNETASAPGSNPTANPANPFAALFGGAGAGGAAGAGAAGAQNPLGGLFGNQAQTGGQQNTLNAMTQQLMQNPEMMRQMMQTFGGGEGGEGGAGGFNPAMFGGMGGFGGQAAPQAPADTRPPEERYEEQLRQLNEMGFYDFDRNVQALRRSGGSVQSAVEYLFANS
ncbi:related to ubiquitin-like protein [Ramularia collo-cygni]|uniref:Related to ubiquitin-like protein n=1 Tax=Ramularia collo-cygni TaxID=112498 RepID=A0A2D3V931_9PEZI|nr:related to ubiquitin-like protein [Ramularia collo-cygni]CZT20136.1 related to ubiquitin-like protein [Ramularia collo-cygni]